MSKVRGISSFALGLVLCISRGMAVAFQMRFHSILQDGQSAKGIASGKDFTARHVTGLQTS